MGIGAFGTVKEVNSCHPRGDLIEDLSSKYTGFPIRNFGNDG